MGPAPDPYRAHQQYEWLYRFHDAAAKNSQQFTHVLGVARLLHHTYLVPIQMFHVMSRFAFSCLLGSEYAFDDDGSIPSEATSISSALVMCLSFTDCPNTLTS